MFQTRAVEQAANWRRFHFPDRDDSLMRGSVGGKLVALTR
jgi:hypothetical protein